MQLRLQKVGLLLALSLWPLPVLGLTPVPASLTNGEIAALRAKYSELTQRKESINARIGQFQVNCANVVVGSAQEKQCEQEQAAIKVVKASYKEEADLYERNLKSAIAKPETEPTAMGATAQAEQEEFDHMNAVWMKKQKQLIEERMQTENRWGNAFETSLRTGHSALPYKKFAELQPGDILLIWPDGIVGDLIRGADNVTSGGTKSPASHTVLVVKNINGKKLFLDNTPGVGNATGVGGAHIITEEVFLKTYGRRGASLAEPAQLGLAQPLKKDEAEKLWAAARELAVKELAGRPTKLKNLIDRTNYGLYGKGNMVCSESSRDTLVKAGRKIPETTSPLKKLVGIYFGPANVFSDEQNFIVSPLGEPDEPYAITK